MHDHPIFTESLCRIRELLRAQASADPVLAARLAALEGWERDVLERCIHSSGDVTIAADLCFSSGACDRGVAALVAGAPILTDTAMAAAAVAPMARRTFGNRVVCVLEWAPADAPEGGTRAAVGMARALADLAPPVPAGPDTGGLAPVVLIGSAPTALELLLEQVADGLAAAPSLLIGMPVGFVGVAESKRHLTQSDLSQICLEGSRGGAGLVAAACNALLRAGWQANATAAPTVQ